MAPVWPSVISVSARNTQQHPVICLELGEVVLEHAGSDWATSLLIFAPFECTSQCHGHRRKDADIRVGDGKGEPHRPNCTDGPSAACQSIDSQGELRYCLPDLHLLLSLYQAHRSISCRESTKWEDCFDKAGTLGLIDAQIADLKS